MLQTIFTVAVTFVFTGVMGNLLLQRWQQRTWTNQQKFLGAEKDYLALKSLFDEIVSLSSKRWFRMQRIVFLLQSDNIEALKERHAQYDAALINWNESFSSFVVRLTFLDSYDTARSLEDKVQERFVKAGRKIEDALKKRMAGLPVSTTEKDQAQKELDLIQSALLTFNRDLLKRIEQKRQDIYYGIPIELGEATLEQFPTWNLMKALFQPRKYPSRIVRSAADLEKPLRSGVLWPGVDE